MGKIIQGWRMLIGSIETLLAWLARKLLTLMDRIRAVVFGVVILVILLVGGVMVREYWLDQHRPAGSFDDPTRAAAIVPPDAMGDSYDKVAYLPQGWTPANSEWFYTTTQGSNLLPYDFFMVLKREDNKELLRSNENMNRYRYLPQKVSPNNPDALPVGFVKNVYKGKQYLGLTCAACHTAQIIANNVALRIDGGPAGADMELFLKELAGRLDQTAKDASQRQEFVTQVMARGNYESAAEVEKDLKKFTLDLYAYNIINRSSTNYGYARLDAFGRIFNRVLQHVLNRDELERVLDAQFPKEEVAALLQGTDRLLTGPQRDLIFARLAERFASQPKVLLRLRDSLFNPPDAPVSYPFLWDIPQHDYVQWNGIAANAGLGPLGRNTGEVLGVFGTLDWTEQTGFSLSRLVQGKNGEKAISFQSSVNGDNLRHLENRLVHLQSPRWKDAEPLLGKIDVERSRDGAKLFDRYCAACHANIDRSDPRRRIVANFSKLEEVGTDARMAGNAVDYRGRSGILRNLYTSAGGGPVLIDQSAPVAALLTSATEGVVATADDEKWFFERWGQLLYNLLAAYNGNEIKPSIKTGNYAADTTVVPYASLGAYKGRSLNGIWATAPYLHNGSVPTLYDLLLPKRGPGDPDGGEYRPDEFMVGSRIFEPQKVGLKSAGYPGFKFQTSLAANSNAGHEYGTREVRLPPAILAKLDEAAKLRLAGGEILPQLTAEERRQLPNQGVLRSLSRADRALLARGEPLPALTEKQRWELVEYLKTL